MKVTGIVVAENDVFVLYPGTAGTVTSVYKTAIGNASSVIVNGGGSGGISNLSQAGVGGLRASTVGTSTFVGATVDTQTPGNSGTAGVLGTIIATSSGALPAHGPDGNGGIPGAVIVVDGISAGIGGIGVVLPPIAVGGSGMVRITFQA